MLSKVSTRVGFTIAAALAAPALVGAGPSMVPSKAASKNVAEVQPLSGVLKIDGSADMSPWQPYRLAAPFAMCEPKRGGALPTGVSTNLYASWGEDALYVAVECLDPDPARIVAGNRRRDTVFASEDYVSIVLDPTGVGHYGYEFRLSAAGVQADARIIDGKAPDLTYDLLWESAVARTKTGWIAKMRIPYRSLSTTRAEWRLTALRSLPRERLYTMTWPLQGERSRALLAYSGKIDGCNVNMDRDSIMAIVTGSAAKDYRPSSGWDNKNNLGLDLRWRGRNGDRADVTIRPDYSALASDVDPVAVNTLYKAVLPERRPFFQEGMNVILDGFGGQVQTRSVMDPLWGMKGAVSRGDWNTSVLATQDSRGGDAIASNGGGTAGMRTRDVAAATSYSMARKEGIGTRVNLTVTDRELLGTPMGESWFSRTVGSSVMADYKKTWTFKGAGVLSLAELPKEVGGKGVSTRGTGHTYELDYDGPNLYGSVYGGANSPDLRLDMGYLPISGVRTRSGELGWVSRFDKGAWSRITGSVVTTETKMWDGSPFIRNTQLGLAMSLTHRVDVKASRTVGDQTSYRGATFDTDKSSLVVTVATVPGHRWSVSYIDGHDVDYSLVMRSRLRMVTGSFNGRVGPIMYSVLPSYQSLRNTDSGLETLRATRIYARLEWALPVTDCFLRVERQTVVTERLRVYNDPTKFLNGRTAVWTAMGCWQPNPFGGIYIGYSHSRASGAKYSTPLDYDYLSAKGLYAMARYAIQF